MSTIIVMTNILVTAVKKAMVHMGTKKEIIWTLREIKDLTIREEGTTMTKICILTNKIAMTSRTKANTINIKIDKPFSSKTGQKKENRIRWINSSRFKDKCKVERTTKANYLKHSKRMKSISKMRTCNKTDRLWRNSNLSEIIKGLTQIPTLFNLKIKQLILRDWTDLKIKKEYWDRTINMVRSTLYLQMMWPISIKDQVEELLPIEIMKMKNEEVLKHPHFCTEIQYNDL